uniref:Uncharacterized protein n=1 Tax=Cycas taitungensis TaxID=54799 RepID=A6H5H6_CYCTA|nr:hypothetical protein CYtaCp034 [Cycas taitungensis]BAF64942.1 hypothetical protein [Cycas taitungensis]
MDIYWHTYSSISIYLDHNTQLSIFIFMYLYVRTYLCIYMYVHIDPDHNRGISMFRSLSPFLFILSFPVPIGSRYPVRI